MNKTKWTEEDKQKLAELVNKYTIKNRTQWKQISQHINRPANQCKTYFTIVVQQQNSKKCNIQWTPSNRIKLIACVAIYGKKWELIRKLEFNDYSAEQLRQKYLLFIRRRKRINLGQKIQNNEQLDPQIFNSYFIEHFLYMYKRIFESDQTDFYDDLIFKKALTLYRTDIKEIVLKIYEQLPPKYKAMCAESK
ncbi:Myb-like_DNA-binding domain-containing protein [Hexamita inflata]|uniref:Myb-like DNA-binding domain-containing protein n=1 Tax=Hexamita inflata TaxID=28002 RepID=A0AA86TQG3_9EUKA|nr:Myb-like DNA-binding domain-containing protein [Hexamita inflata]CAI9924889.1 Myb-like DNA-binding domain-containing protein [Hexamita inflata]